MTDRPNAERYVAGTLSEEETARFEAEMIERPELAADVNVRQRIKAGLSVLEERRELEGFLKEESRSPGMRRFAAAAAVALFAITGTWMFLRETDPTPGTALLSAREAGTAAVSATVLLTLTRSGTPPPRLSASRSELLHLQVPADETTGDAEVKLSSRKAGESMPVSSPVMATASAQGFIDVYLDAAHLQSGDFVLEVIPQGGDVQRLPFTLQIVD